MPILATSATAARNAPETATLESLLERLAGTAGLYRERALSFACEETIRGDKKGETGRQRFGYVVVFDDDKGFDDYRTRLKRNPKSPPRRVEPEDYRVPAYLRSAYLWIFVFRRERQRFHEYEIVGEEELFGRPALMIRFEPVPPYRERVNDWHGTAWIDPESAQLLKVEAHRPEDHEMIDRIERHEAGEAVSDWVYTVERVTTEFTVEKGCLRFPGRVELRRVSHDFLHGSGGFDQRERVILWVSQKYTNYEFFDVESAAELPGGSEIEP
jgi:hypothetical protein